MNPARLLYFIDTLKVGGAQHHLLDVLEGLDESRFDPRVCSLGQPTELSHVLETRGVETRSLGLSNIYGPKAIRSLPGLVRWIRECQIELVHTYLPSSNVYGMLAARLAGVPVLISSRRDMGFSRSWRISLLEQLLVNPQVDRVVAVCEAVASATCRELFLDSQNVVTIYNGVDSSHLDLMGAAGAIRSLPDIHLQPGVPVVTAIGSLTPVKAHEVLLEAAARVIQAGEPAAFILIGDGPLRADCERRAADLEITQHVYLVGQVPKDRIREFLSVTDIGTLTSDTEGISNALLEYMAYSRPVVATKVGGNPEVVDDGRSGLLVEPRDPQALADALLSLLRDSQTAAAMGREGRRRVETIFSRGSMLSSLEALYTSLLGLEQRSPYQATEHQAIERISR